MVGNNLPKPSDVVNLYKSENIEAMRLYGPSQAALQALKDSKIQLILDVPNPYLQSFAYNPSAANEWVQKNVKAYHPDVSFKYISVGNEVIPGDHARYVLPAMRNIFSALCLAGLQNEVNVSTAVSTGVLGASYPPSAGAFSSNALNYLRPIVEFLARNRAPLLVNVYPYFSYVGNPNSTKIEFALFTSLGTFVIDGLHKYQNLFDAIVDAVHSALEKVGGSDVEIVVSESGWPSAGGIAASINNAMIYNQNLIRHVGQGTPKRPGRAIDTFLFEMFNENQKPQGIEKNFGLFFPNKQPVYPINFS